MTNFINLDFDNKTARSLINKHFLFSIVWMLGILILAFRIDSFLFSEEKTQWIHILLPSIYILITLQVFWKLKWDQKLVLIVYPFLIIIWFIPKLLIKKQKLAFLIYYLTRLFSAIKKWKKTLSLLFLFFSTIILSLAFGSPIVRILTSFSFTYFYWLFLKELFVASFSGPGILTEGMKDDFRLTINSSPLTNSIIISKYVISKKDEKLQQEERDKKNLERAVYAFHGMLYISEKLSKTQSRKRFVIGAILKLSLFLFVSIGFFWMLNFQLFKIDPESFHVVGKYPYRDFFHYTVKSVVNNDVNEVTANSWISEIIAIISWAMVGVGGMGLIYSLLLTIRQDKMKEDNDLTKQYISTEGRNLELFIQETYNLDAEGAKKHVEKFDENWSNYRGLIDFLL